MPVPRRRNTLTPDLNEETDGSATPAPMPPPTPSKSLKPTLHKSTEDLHDKNEAFTSTGDDVTSQNDPKPVDEPKPLSLPQVLPLKFPGIKPTAAPRCTKSLDRRDMVNHSKARSASNSVMVKPVGEIDVKAMMLKAQALKLPAFPEVNPPIAANRGKSRSMSLLDRYEDLPPPPEPPMVESVSDIETNSEFPPVQKQQPRKKRRDRSKSNPNTTDDEEEMD